MSGITLEPGRLEGEFRMVGELTLDTVTDALAQADDTFTDTSRLSVDLSGLERVDSAGLALLVDWLSETRTEGQAIRYESPPEQLLALARVSGVDGMLPFAARNETPGPGRSGTD